ncbi:LPXTG cell wall anchor domain-containing protein, partial [Blautia sp.]|uniref:LPXTG cell wall anchor domain-containing protein n=1 Tax=Blautia sp. TaxID=1955243 RepID=UPI0026273E7A
TYIDENGTLYVSKAETADEVKVKAVSKADAKKFDEAVVKIKKAQTQVPGTNTNNNCNNTTTGKPAGNQGVQTGDESHVVILLGLLAVSGGVLLIGKRKRQ